jgi:peptidoglycan/xylan/chitin deacetylase (PgdA/CDA1 family)
VSKRDKVSAALSRIGLLRLLELLPKRNSLLALNYHRIGDAATTPFDEGVFSASASEFDEQMALVRRHCGVVSLEEALDLLGKGRPWRGMPTLITFDDGYLDNYQHAFPILKSHGVVAAFFLVSSFVGASQLPWWDRIAWVVRRSRKQRLLLRYPRPIECPLPPGRRTIEIQNLLNAFKSAETTDPDRFLSELEAECDIEPAASESTRLFLDWEEAREMARAGMAIGSHTHTHRILAKLTTAEQGSELRTSRELIRAGLGSELSSSSDVLAYPVGGRSSFDGVTRASLKEAGYRAAFSYYGGLNLPEGYDRFDVRRVSVDAGTTVSRFRTRLCVAGFSRTYWF